MRFTSADDASSAWLAAYALGLAYAHCSDTERRGQLCMAAEGSLANLEMAHGRLQVAVVAEPALQARALGLLREVMDHLAAPGQGPELVGLLPEPCLSLAV